MNAKPGLGSICGNFEAMYARQQLDFLMLAPRTGLVLPASPLGGAVATCYVLFVFEIGFCYVAQVSSACGILCLIADWHQHTSPMTVIVIGMQP